MFPLHCEQNDAVQPSEFWIPVYTFPFAANDKALVL